MKQVSDTPAEIARRLVRAADRAVLSTALAENDWPYGSLVMTACGHDARPLLLISDLAEHTKNLKTDARASLLFDGTAGLENPLTGARVSILGRISPCDDDALRARYVARHPDAETYLGFTDFGLYRLDVERAHLVSGFGEIHWIEGRDILFDTASTSALADAEAGIVEHMNDDHADAILLYATVLARRAPGEWQMTGIDPEGIDLKNGGEICRIAFENPVKDATDARTVLVEMVNSARRAGET